MLGKDFELEALGTHLGRTTLLGAILFSERTQALQNSSSLCNVDWRTLHISGFERIMANA